MSFGSLSALPADGSIRQYLDYFNIDGKDAGGGVGTVTALIFGIVSDFTILEW